MNQILFHRFNAASIASTESPSASSETSSLCHWGRDSTQGIQETLKKEKERQQTNAADALEPADIEQSGALDDTDPQTLQYTL